METWQSRGYQQLFGMEGKMFAPRVDEQAVEDSFRLHMSIQRDAVSRCTPPSDAELRKALFRIEDILSYMNFAMEEDWDSREKFMEALIDVDMDSSPGFEMGFYGSTNREVLGWDGVRMDEVKVNTLFAIVQDRLRDLETAPTAGWIKMFIKHEPHKLAKVKQGRYRVISSVSLVDTVIDRMLFPGLYDRAVARAYDGSPIAVGWSYIGGIGFLSKKIKNPYAVDMSSWDWTVTDWMAGCAWHIMDRFCVNADERWRRITAHRLSALFRATFVLPSGTVVEQIRSGIVKSGSWFTLFLNSVLQLLVDEVVMERHPEARRAFRYFMGDDTIKEDHLLPDDVYLAELSGLGLIAKLAHREFEFCGMMIDSASPQYRAKHLWTLDHCCPDVLSETLASYRLLYHQSTNPADIPFKKFLLDELAKRNPSMVMSNSRLDGICLGYE